MFIYFSPVWKFHIVTRERINTCFCTELGVTGHLGACWEETNNRDAYGIFVCNGFSFIGMVSGDWHKGRGVWGRGVFWKTKAGSHSRQKIERDRGGVWEGFYLSVLGENLRSLSCLSSFSLPSSRFLFFLYTSHYLTKLLFPLKHSLWPATVRDLHEHKQVQTHPW